MVPAVVRRVVLVTGVLPLLIDVPEAVSFGAVPSEALHAEDRQL